MININRLIKCLMVVMILTTIFLVTNVEAEETSLEKMTSQANKFLEEGSKNAKDIKYDKITSEFTGLGKILTTVGSGVMVAVITYMGIKYLTSGPEAQAKLKTQLIGVVVSGVVIFGAYTIWSIVIKVAETF